MAIRNPAEWKSLRLDKAELQRKTALQETQMGLTTNPKATAKKAREMMLAQGVRPEDKILSGEIIRMRYEEKE